MPADLDEFLEAMYRIRIWGVGFAEEVAKEVETGAARFVAEVKSIPDQLENFWDFPDPFDGMTVAELEQQHANLSKEERAAQEARTKQRMIAYINNMAPMGAGTTVVLKVARSFGPAANVAMRGVFQQKSASTFVAGATSRHTVVLSEATGEIAIFGQNATQAAAHIQKVMKQRGIEATRQDFADNMGSEIVRRMKTLFSGFL